MYVAVDLSDKQWEDFMLIMPAVSVGNVGQLTVDLLLSTLPVTQVGFLYNDNILPVIGNDPFTTDSTAHTCNLMTAAEVYECKQHKLVIVQQRAPLVKGKKAEFVSQLMEWIKSCHFTRIIIPTSSYAHERIDKQLTGSQLRYLLTPPMETAVGEELRGKLGWQELERRAPADPSTGCSTGLFLPGSGIARSLYEKCIDAGIHAAVLLLFCSEGDNAIDAIGLASHLNSWLHLVELPETDKHRRSESMWKTPPSWKLQFGRPFQKTLF